MTVQRRTQDGATQDARGKTPRVPSLKKKFVEPEISQPVDVLEATTYFQAVESGATN